ncbi:hypothetical protein [Streptomyces sp. CHB9.2]|uniref:hypothetical protein n=1 Tax=Streptomyces sp. CHB9.2 TaxID=2841670 RepID=UPI00209459D9|nr:hypothetical protein [Streptomyces sp. CHB9.2]MCO6704796.1 hypothetical protein [Streptomyces sp. CHB9.2]
MALSTKALADHVNKKMCDRFELLIKLGVTKDITLEFTRSELRGLTKTDRIQDISISRMIKKLQGMGYVVKGKSDGEVFRVTFRVLDYLCNSSTLAEAEETNDYLEEIIMRPTVVSAVSADE